MSGFKEREKLIKIDAYIRHVSNPEYLSKRNDNHKYIFHIPYSELERQIKKFEDWKATTATNR